MSSDLRREPSHWQGAMPLATGDGPSVVNLRLKVTVLMRGLFFWFKFGGAPSRPLAGAAAAAAVRRRAEASARGARDSDPESETWLPRCGAAAAAATSSAHRPVQPRPSRAFAAHWHRAPDGAGYVRILQPPQKQRRLRVGSKPHKNSGAFVWVHNRSEFP